MQIRVENYTNSTMKNVLIQTTKSYQYYLDSTNYKGNNSDIIDSNTLPWRELTEFSSDLDKAESNTTTKATTEKSTTEKATQSTAKHLDEDWVSLDQLKSKNRK